MKNRHSASNAKLEPNAEGEERLVAMLRELDGPLRPDSYFDDFLLRFREHQRSELLSRSSLSLFWERLQTVTDNLTAGRWLLAGGAAYASILLALVIFINANSQAIDDPVLVPVSIGERSAGEGGYYVPVRVYGQRILPLSVGEGGTELEESGGAAVLEPD